MTTEPCTCAERDDGQCPRCRRHERFLAAYVGAALWSSTDDDGEPLDAGRDADDLAPETLAAMDRECQAFEDANAEMLRQAGDAERNGHDFWLTRNRHGVGYWDRRYPRTVGDALTIAAHNAGERHLYIGDDGRVHQDII